MRIIFLDIDGVLNDQHPNFTDEGFKDIDDDKIEILKKITERTGCKIVLTSDRREGFPNEPYYLGPANKLKKHGILIFDRTKEISPSKRGSEILEWLSRNPAEDFTILDDRIFDYLDCKLLSNFIRTDFSDMGIKSCVLEEDTISPLTQEIALILAEMSYLEKYD